jgi:hypothetical protein
VTHVPDPAWRVVYDASSLWFPAWSVAAWGLVAGAIGGALLRGARRLGRAETVARWTRWAGTTLAIFGPAWTVVMGVGLYGEHARLRDALRSGDYTTVVGFVHDRPSISDGSDPAWVVESGPTAHWYRYGIRWWGPGYRRLGPGDAGLRDGAEVRIADVDGRIARIEVRD